MKNATQISDDILTAMLPAVPFDGWTESLARQAAGEAGYAPAMACAVFPAGPADMAAHFADMADRGMLAALAGVDADSLKIRERVTLAVRERINWLSAHKEAERAALAFWLRPMRKYRGGKIVWRTADRIWTWAGDTSADYNRYTKRALLSGVLASTMVFWMQDQSEGSADTHAFLDRRIANVLQWGKAMGGLASFGKFGKKSA